MSRRRIYDDELHAQFVTFSCYQRRRLLGHDYIYLNPVRAGLVEKAVDRPWSSARYFGGKRCQEPFLGARREKIPDTFFWTVRSDRIHAVPALRTR